MARAFNGTSDYIAVFFPLQYPFSFSCWFQTPNTTLDQAILAAGNPGMSDDDRIVLQTDGSVGGDPIAVLAAANGGSSFQAQSTTGYTANVWCHACGVMNSATSRSVFLNGASKVTNTTSVVMTGLLDVLIGTRLRSGTLGTFFEGAIAEVGVWTSALGDAEVGILAKGFAPRHVSPSHLRIYLPLVNDLIDVFGNTLTVSGTTKAPHPRIYA